MNRDLFISYITLNHTRALSHNPNIYRVQFIPRTQTEELVVLLCCVLYVKLK